MLNMRNQQLDKIIITAMDRFVWFVLLVVISHLVTEFTRATGYTRVPRQDVVTVNDSLIQPIKVQNLVLFPGQEYGLYEQENQQYYNGNSLYNNYANTNHKLANMQYNNNNFLSSLIKQFTNNSSQNEKQQQTQMKKQNQAKPFNFQGIIDSVFQIPLSTLRAINYLLRSLTGGYLQPQQQLQQQEQQQYAESFAYAIPATLKTFVAYDTEKSAAEARAAKTPQPKAQFEILTGKRTPTKAAVQVSNTN